MRLIQSALLVVFSAATWAGSAAAASSLAAPTSSPSAAKDAPSPSDAAAPDEAPAANAGVTIDGRISSIDYHSGKMTVDVGEGGGRKSYDVLVVPGTNIQGQKDFHTIADLKKGAHVEVLISRHGSTNTAQIIRLL